jgi:Ca2+-binding RTX toxin-like protein
VNDDGIITRGKMRKISVALFNDPAQWQKFILGHGNDNGSGENEDGTTNEATTDVAGWLDYFLNGVNSVFGNNTHNVPGSGEHSSIFADARNEIIYTHGRNDTIYEDDGADNSGGGDGNDRMYGDAGRDLFWGDKGNDEIHGGADHDELGGSAGNDPLYGGPGKDSLSGNENNDTLL